jgi:hypothetical protein
MAASSKEIGDWIIQNADKKGTPDFETMAVAYKAAKESEKTPEPVGGWETLGRSTAHGAAFGFDDELVGQFDKEAGEKWKARGEQAAKDHPVIDFVGNMVGGIASPIAAGFLLPESAALAGAGLAAKGATYLPKGIQAFRADRAAKAAAGTLSKSEKVAGFAGRAAKSGGIGAGYGGLMGAGDAEEGHRLEGAGEGAAIGAAFGTALHPLVEGAGTAVKFAKRKLEPFLKGASGLKGGDAAQRKVNETLPGGIKPDTSGDNIPGYKPMVESDEGIALAKELDLDAVKTRIAENKAAIKNAPKPGGQEQISTPFKTGADKLKTAQDDATAAIEKEAMRVEGEKSVLMQKAAAERERLAADVEAKTGVISDEANAVPTYAGSDPKNLRKATAVYNKAEASKSVRNVIDLEEAAHDKAVLDAWKALSPETTRLNATKAWKAKITKSVASHESEPINKFLARIKGLNEKTNLAEVQTITSDLKAFARDAYKRGDHNDARIARKLDKTIFETIKNDRSVLSAGNFGKWKKNIDASTQYYKKWDNYVTGKYLADESLTADAAVTLDNFLIGKPNETKSRELLNVITDQKGVVNKDALQHIENYLGHDLIDDIGDKLINPEGLGKWQAKYANIFKTFPGLRDKFGNFETAIRTAADSVENAKLAKRAVEFESMAKSIEAAKLQSPGDIPVYKYLPNDPTDPNAIKGSMEKILREDNPKSMQDFLDVVGRTQESLSGTKHLLAEMMVGAKSPSEFIGTHRAKLDEVFTSKAEQEYLDAINKASSVLEKQKVTKAEEQAKSALDHTLKTATTAGLKGYIGYFWSITGARIVDNLANIPRDRMNKIIVDGLMDPNGLGKTLSKPMPVSDTKGWREVYSRIIPGIIAGQRSANEEGANAMPKPKERPPIPRININTSPKYAAGGPVYTHPAISSIRAKRAMRSFSR